MISSNRPDTFAERGYLQVEGLFTARECRRLIQLFETNPTPPVDWFKGLAVTSRPIFEVAADSKLLHHVRQILGGDLILWGVSLLEREPGQVHPWHSDLESCAPDARTVSLWIGLDQVNANSSLHVIAGSHRLGRTVQEASRERGWKRGEVDETRVVELAKGLDPSCEMVKPDMKNGDGIYFDGRLWHGSCNTNASGVRKALLIQYAHSGTPIRIPNFSRFNETERFRESPLPPCVLLCGDDGHGVNRIVPPPTKGDEPQINPITYTFELPDDPPEDFGRCSDIAFVGGTPLMRLMSCHASVLGPDRVPHPPHVHDDEEILMMWEGEMDLVLVDEKDGQSIETRHRIKPGQFVYYPLQRRHTLHNPGSVPSKYVMLKWKSHHVDGKGALPTRFIDFDAVTPAAGADERGIVTVPLMEDSTKHLRRLHSHMSILEPGGGYEPHADAYDVAILTIEGEVETLGRRVPPRSVIYYPAGTLHGIRNVGQTRARYVVFEFHASVSQGLPKPFPALRRHLRPLKQMVRRVVKR